MPITDAELAGSVEIDEKPFVDSLNKASAAWDGFNNNLTQSAGNVDRAMRDIGTAAQSSANSIQSSFASAAASTAAYGPQISEAFTRSFSSISAQAQTALTGAASAFRAFTAEGQTSLQGLATSQAQLQAALTNVQQAIREESSALASMSAQMASGAAVSKTLASEIARTEQIVGQLTTEEAALRASLSQTTAAINQQSQSVVASAAGIEKQSKAVSVATVSFDKKKQSVEGVSEKMGLWSNLLNTTTSQVSTQNSVLTGYDAILQAVLRSVGGIPVVWAAAATIGLQLVSTIISLSKNKKEAVEITDKLASSDIALAAAFDRMATAAGLSGEEVRKQAGELAKLSQIDVKAMFLSLDQAMKNYLESGDKVVSLQAQLVEAQSKQEQAQKLVDQGMLEHLNTVATFQSLTLSLKDSIIEQTAARDKENATVNKSVEGLVNLVRQGDLTAAQMQGMAQATLEAGRGFNEFQARVNVATSAVHEFNRAVAAFRLPNIDIKATTEGLAKAREEINKTVTGLTAGGKSMADALTATKPALDQYIKSTKEKIAADAAAAGKTLTHAQAQAKLKEAISGAPDGVAAYAAKVGQLDKNLGAFSESTKKAGGATSALKKEIHAVTQSMNEWLNSLGNGIKTSDRLFAQLPKIVRENMKAVSDSFLANSDALQLWAVQLQIQFSKAKANMKVFVEDGKIALRELKVAVQNANIDSVLKFKPPSILEVLDTNNIKEAMKRSTGDIIKIWAEGQDQLVAITRKGAEESAAISLENSRKLTEYYQQMSDDIVSIAGEGIGGALVKISQGLGLNLQKVRDWTAGVVNVIDTLPGHFGEVARGVYSTIDRWIQFGNSVLGVLHKISSNIPASIGDLFTKLKGQFSAGFGNLLAIAGSFAGSLASFFGAKGAGGAGGAVMGGVGGFLGFSGIAKALGFTVTGLGGPIGLAAIGIGSLLGGLFGRKSSAQKKAEEEAKKQAAENAKISMQEAAQSVINSALEGFQKAMDFMENLEGFTAPRKAKFQEFFRALQRLLDNFVEMSKAFTSDTLASAKALAETIGPVGDAISSSVNAMAGIFEVPVVETSKIQAFFSNFKTAFNLFAAMADEVANDVQKRAARFGERLGPVVEAIDGIVGPLKELFDFTPVDPSRISAFTNNLSQLALSFGSAMRMIGLEIVKEGGRFAAPLQQIMESIKATLEVATSLTTYAGIPQEAFDAVTKDLQRIVDWAGSLISLGEEGITRFETLQSVISRMAAAMKGAGTAISGLASGVGGTASQSLVYEPTYTATAASGARSAGPTTINQYSGDVSITLSLRGIEELMRLPNAVERLRELIYEMRGSSGQLTVATNQI